MRGKGRGRGRGGRRGEIGATEETAGFNSHLSSQNLDVLRSPGVLRSPTTRSRAANIAKCSTLPSSPLRRAVRCVNEAPPQQPPKILPEHGGTTIQVPTNFGESKRGINAIGDDNSSNIGPKSHCMSRADTTNITEFARKLRNEQEHDPDEVESTLDPHFDYVNGYKVKKGISPLLKSIFETHGDITAESDSKSKFYRTIHLEHVCDIYTRLEKTSLSTVSCAELDDMLLEVADLERQKVNVGWLREKITYIHQTMIQLNEYVSVKDEAAENAAAIGSLEKQVEVYRREMENYKQDISVLENKISLRQQSISDVQQRISAVEEELAVKRAKADHHKQMVGDIRNRISSLKNRSFVDGLLKNSEA